MTLTGTFLALALACQTPEPASAPPPAAPPDAHALWERLCKASAGVGKNAASADKTDADKAGASQPAREPLRAFQLQADVLTRNGVQTNQAHIDYRFLAPDCIRFVLPSQNETGRFGPAQEQYWLKKADGNVIVLAGRDFKEDRRSVDDMLALAKNYVALSDPARLNLLLLEIPPVPADLGPELQKRTQKLTWLALESPDFALVRSDTARETPSVYRVEIGLRGEDGLPGVAIVREKAKAGADPLLVEFSKYEERDGFRIPLVLLVHVLDRKRSPASFSELASQEVYVTAAALRPALTIADFQPKKKDDPKKE
jgi:hypothetical protein